MLSLSKEFRGQDMAIPTFEEFIEPLLQFLATHPEGARTTEAYAALADACQLSESDRAQLLPTGRQPLYQNRITWAHDRLKRAGISSSPQRGLWQITEPGKRLLAKHNGHLPADALNASLAIVGGDVPDPILRIGMIAAAHRRPVSVTRDTSLREAVTLMLLRDYSQLPVMQSERSVNGFVSWKSIGRRYLLQGSCEFVRDAMDESVSTVDEEAPLFDVLDTINKNDFVLVQNRQKLIVGIVTQADLGEQFKEMSEPFLLLGIIENQIRRLVAGKFPVEILRAARNPAESGREIKAVFDMSFGEYVRLFENEENWKRLRLPVDRRKFTEALASVRDIRNDVMHFDPDFDEADATQELRDFVRFLREIEPIETQQ
jgi:CBS domain-containing protein